LAYGDIIELFLFLFFDDIFMLLEYDSGRLN